VDVIDERELRDLLRGRPPANVMISTVMKQVLDEQIPWEDRRPYWHFLHQTGRASSVVVTLIEALKNKTRIPFNILAHLTADAQLRPEPLHVQAFLKGLRKQHSLEDSIDVGAWATFDRKFDEIREHLMLERASRQERYKVGLREKFEFLRSQRMLEQAGRVLRRMIALYPEEQSYAELKVQFDEERAREVLANRTVRAREKFERTQTVPSTSDQEMLKCFVEEGIKILVEKRDIAADLAVALWFMDDFAGAGEILAWAAPSPAVDWMRVEVMIAGRRFLDGLEAIAALETKYALDPESTFAAAYARAQCLRELGQEAAALETMQSIVRVRPNYRSAHALILEWTDGAEWS